MPRMRYLPALARGLHAVALLAFAACAPTVVNNGVRVRESYWHPVWRELGARGTNDLQCPKVKVNLLERQGKAPVSVSVRGCGGLAVYHRQLRHHHGFLTTTNSTWELISLSRGTPSVAPAPAAVAANPYESTPSDPAAP